MVGERKREEVRRAGYTLVEIWRWGRWRRRGHRQLSGWRGVCRNDGLFREEEPPAAVPPCQVMQLENTEDQRDG